MADAILRNTQATISISTYQDESATPADGNVTITIYRDSGDAIVTDAAVVSDGLGGYSYSLEPQTELDLLTAEWSGTFDGSDEVYSTDYEIVSGFYAQVPEIRALDVDSSGIGNEAKFSTEMVEAARRATEQLFENYCGQAFLPRYARDVLSGNGTDTLWLTKRDTTRLVSVVEDDIELDTADWALEPWGELYRPSGTFSEASRRNIAVTYEHGLKRLPADVKRVALIYIAYLLNQAYSGMPDRSISYNDDGLFVQLSQPGPNRATGIPDVDAVLNRYRRVRAERYGIVSG